MECQAMRRAWMVIALTFALLLQGSGFGSNSQSAAAKGQTAKAGLEQARQVAKKWRTDAILVYLSSNSVSKDGTVSGDGSWQYIFHSPTAKKEFIVDIGGPTVESDEIEFPGNQAITGDFVDSDRVMNEVIKNGFKAKGNISMGLAYTSSKTLKPGLYWFVKDAADPTSTAFAVDPRTGKFLGKESGQR